MSYISKTGKFASIAALLESSPPTGVPLSSLIRQLKEIQNIWVTIVSSELAEHSLPTFFQYGQLTISADSPVWANRIRHYQISILRQFHKQGLTKIKNIRVHVLPANQRYRPISIHRKSASKKAQKAIHSTAVGIQDVELQAALLKLSRAVRS